jgi:hypothetical protein
MESAIRRQVDSVKMPTHRHPTFQTLPKRFTNRYLANPYGATMISVNGRPPTLSPAARAAVEYQVDRIASTLRCAAGLF